MAQASEHVTHELKTTCGDSTVAAVQYFPNRSFYFDDFEVLSVIPLEECQC